ncbi:MAG: LysM peptidoglycan-binding domain-containing protein [Spartobacteria bacterium]
MFIKALTILFLVAAILGGSGYFIYELYYKEKKLDVVEQAAVPTPTPAPTPHPALAAFDSLQPVLAQNTVEARDAIAAHLGTYPDSPKAAEARAAIGRINLILFRDPSATPSNTLYTVKKGDSLDRIKSQFKTNSELIYWANGMTSINLQIGQQLLIPVVDTALVIDRATSTVTLLNAGAFFKEYPAVSMVLTGQASKGEIEAKVADRIARKGEARVAFGAKDYAEAERTVLINPGNVVLRTPPAPAADGSTPPTPSGIVFNPQDFDEIYALVKSGTPVTIK